MTSAAVAAGPAVDDGRAHWSRRQLAALVAATVVAIALRLLHIEDWSWNDAEAATWRAVAQPWFGANGLFAGAEGLAPLGWIALRTLLALGMHDAEGWMRLPFAFCGVLAVPLLAFAARAQLGARAALLAAACLAVHPLHVAASQTASPPVAAVTLVLGAAAMAPWSVRGAWAVLVAAALTSPIAWLAVAVALVRRWPTAVAVTVAAAAAAGAALTCGALTLPVVLLAAFGVAAARPLVAPRPAAAALLPLAAAALFAPWHAGAAADATLLALPAVIAFAVSGAVRVFAAAAPSLRGSPRAAALGAALPGALLAVWLLTDLGLQLVIYGGGRTPWRVAADAVWSVARTPGAIVLGAAAGAAPLACYLCPERARGGDDAEQRTGRAVVSLDLAEPAGSLAALAARPEPHVLLALREDEFERLAASATGRAALAAFARVLVVASPAPRGLGSVHLFQAAR